MTSCEHTFVTQRFGGFYCEDCEELFAQYPSDLQKRKSDMEIFTIMQQFIDAKIDYPEALNRTGLRTVEFKEVFRKMLPKNFKMTDVHTIGQANPTPIVTGLGPRRTSDPESIHSFFSNCLGKLPRDHGAAMNLINQQFPDVTSITTSARDPYGIVFEVTFVDNTGQLVFAGM